MGIVHYGLGIVHLGQAKDTPQKSLVGVLVILIRLQSQKTCQNYRYYFDRPINVSH